MKSQWLTLFNRPAPNFALRLVLMLAGQACIAFAIALSRTTDLGTSTLSCIPAVLSILTPVSLGTLTFFMNLVFMAGQIAILRRYFKPSQLLALPLLVYFSAAIDFFVPICELFPMPNYPARMGWILLSCAVMGLGAWLQRSASLIMVPGDGLVLALSVKLRAKYYNCKIGFDLTMTALGAVLSLATMGGLFGVREGTVIAAFLVGPFIKLWHKLLKRYLWAVPVAGHVDLTPKIEAQ